MRLAPLLCALALTACASTGALAPHPNDPYEATNRKVFAFNEVLDRNLIKPVAEGYQAVVPAPVRESVGNFFGNLGDAWSAVNWLLQGEFHRATEQGARFAWNTTVGVVGLFDVSHSFGLERRSQDFGMTLGAWGVGMGNYLVLPVFGPSSFRELAALPVNRLSGSSLVFQDAAGRLAASALELVSVRASLLSAERVVDGVALDKYTFYRDAFLQRRGAKKAQDEDEFEIVTSDKK